MGTLRLRAKILLTMGLSVLVLTLVLTVTNLRTMDALVREAELHELSDHVKAVSQSIAAEGRMAEALASMVAAIPLVQEKFAAGDRAGLSGMLLPAYRALAQPFGVEQFQFHTPPATSFLRLHKPEKFGDDLSSFRRTVVETNQKRIAIRGLETGVAGLGIRGVVPMEAQGKPTGSVEIGLAFNQSFFDAFKQRQGVDLALHLVNGGKITTFGSTFGPQPLAPSEALLKAFAGEAQLMELALNGNPVALYVSGLRDYSGATIGTLEVAMDRSRYVATLAEARNTALLVGGLVLAAGLLLAQLAARHLTRRIGQVQDGVECVARGDLTVETVVDGRDELAELARAAGRMRAQLHDLALDVRRCAGKVHAAAREISSSVTSEAQISSEMSASVAEITATMEELSATSTQIAEHAQSVAGIANITYESSKKGSDAMQVVLTKMSDIQRDNQNSLHEIIELGSRSKEISKVMVFIDTLAGQTKLIAFNAALEAASAGEAGSRFGVVASEIRRLADSVTDSTSEIESRIAEIQESIQRLVVTSEKGAKGIAFGLETASETASSLSEMVSAAHQTSSAAQQISLSTQQQRTASSQVVSALREIVTASSHTARSIERLSSISLDMARLSDALDTLVNRFRLRDA